MLYRRRRSRLTRGITSLATFDGTTGTLYVNGTPVATATLSGGYTASATPLVIGSASWESGGYVTGAFDDFSYFNRVLSTAELRSLVVAGTAEHFKKPRPLLTLTYTVARIMLDSVGSNNGKIVGGVSYAAGSGRAQAVQLQW